MSIFRTSDPPRSDTQMVKLDPDALTLTEIMRLQNWLSEILHRRFERWLAPAFSDVVGSTEYFGRHGNEEGRRLQQLHLDLLSHALTGSGGRIVDTAGDGAFLCFGSVDGAAAAFSQFHRLLIQANQGRPRAHQLAVRQGIHWAACLTDGVIVTGEGVNVCSRVASSAAPNEIRLTLAALREVSDARRRAACARIPQVSLKGIAGPVDLAVFDWRDREVFPNEVVLVEVGDRVALPNLDTIRFGRLSADEEGATANEVVLRLSDTTLSKQISRWHFELRREIDGYHLVPVTDQITEVDGAPISRGARVRIVPGTVVRVGRALTLRFQNAALTADWNATSFQGG